MERSTYCWYYDGSPAKAQQIADTGATKVWVKAGGDRGVVWIPDPEPEGFENEQWDDAYLSPLTYRNIAVNPWFYNWPVDQDKTSVLVALGHRWADEIALNPEMEWRVQSPQSPYANLTRGNQFAEAWVRDLRARIAGKFGKAPRIGFSGVPSWADFPYEGFAAACDFAHPQHYWHDELMAGGENQVEAHYRRAPNSPAVPILTACREYDDPGVLRLAQSALLHPIQGLSSWEAGNKAWQADAMRFAYTMLPDDGGHKEPIMTEAEKLKQFGDTIPYFCRGDMMQEGIADLREFGGSEQEWTIKYQRISIHRLAGQSFVWLQDEWDRLRLQGKVILYS